MTRAVHRWREDALDIVARPHLYTESQRRLAWRFLLQWGVE